jgi:energy-coupling factor transporter ATP-binding protein EcfA2
MTEGQDVTAPAAPRAVSAPAEAAAGWAFGRGLPGSPGSDSAPAGSGPAGAAVTVTAPASDAGWMSAPPGDLAATAARGQGGTGWPGPDSAPGSGRTDGGPPDADPAGPGGPRPAAGPAEAGSGGAARTGVDGGSWFGSGPRHQADASEPGDDEPFARVDAKKLEAALLGLRHPIVTVPLLLEAPGVTEARAERVKLLSQIDDYLLPRLRQSGAPILVALVGSTGAGKSTLMNSLVGKQVSATGIRRPTTNSPVLACHPDDMRWFAENVFLPTLPRVRQQGLAMPGRDGLLVLAASEAMPQGVALLDTPDIDSVVQAHRDFAHQFLDASDLWLFVTTARRYADAAVWEMLKDARDRGAALAIALSRVPPPAARELGSHFDAMLEANGLHDVHRFVIPETVVTEAMLPAEVAAPVKEWLTDTARREDRRVAVLTQTMSGMLDTFRDRVPALADQVSGQLTLRLALQAEIESAYAAVQADLGTAAGNGSLLSGEVLARWQDFAGTGDLLRTLQVRRSRAGKQKKHRTPARATAVQDALQASLESLVAAAADRAAEAVVAGWRRQPAGASLLTSLDIAAGRGAGTTAMPSEADFVATALADLGVASAAGLAGPAADTVSLSRATPELRLAVTREVRAWQQHVVHLVTEENVTKRSIARVVSFDQESLALVLMIGVLGPASPENDAASAVSRRLLTSLFGAGLLRDLGTRIRHDLSDRLGRLLDREQRRFFAVIDSAGVPEETAASELLQAGYALEDAR